MGYRFHNRVIQLPFTHISIRCLLITILNVFSVTAQTDYCSGGTSIMDNCLNEIGILHKNPAGVPTSDEDLNAVCSDFKNGMKCLHDFATTCLKEQKRQTFELHFGPAIHFMKQLCENQTLRQEYLKYPECHKQMNPEWERCSTPFIALVHSQNVNTKDHSEAKILQICCSKLCFLDCILEASQSKCAPEAAIIHQDLAKSLNGSPESNYNCTSLVNSSICKKSCNGSNINSFSFLQMFLVLTYCFLSVWFK